MQNICGDGLQKMGHDQRQVSAMILKISFLKAESLVEVYDPSRFVLTSITSFVSIKRCWKLVSGKLKPVSEEIDVKKGEAVIAILMETKWEYTDNKEQLHFVDTTCTHMGCELKWNDAENLDCPCHGSRFTYEGEIIEVIQLMSCSMIIKRKQDRS